MDRRHPLLGCVVRFVALVKDDHPGRVFADRAWRVAYAECRAETLEAARWGRG